MQRKGQKDWAGAVNLRYDTVLHWEKKKGEPCVARFSEKWFDLKT